MRWKGHVAGMGDMRNVFKIVVGNPEGKGPLRRPRHRWKDNIRMKLGGKVDSSGSGEGLVAGFCEQSNEPLGSIKGG
jgi:hypothetical protein